LSWSRERSEKWRTDPGPATAAGGQISPEVQTGPVAGPAEGERSASTPRSRWRARGSERTDVIPRAEVSVPARDPDAYGGRRRRGAGPHARRVRRTLRHVDPLSVLKLSLMYYACLLVLWLIAVAVLYSVLSSFGVFETIEKAAKGLRIILNGETEGVARFDIDLFLVERWALLAGIAFGILASIGNVILAFLYNLSSDVVGGVELTFVERDL
jgi:hypothetical protein